MPEPGCTNPDIGALLHAYELGALSEEDIERFETHLMQCEHCFREVQEFDESADQMRTDRFFRDTAATAKNPATIEPLMKKLWRYLWPDAPLVFRPALAYLLLILMAVPLFRMLPAYRMMAAGPFQIQFIEFTAQRSAGDASLCVNCDLDALIRFHYDGARPETSYVVSIVFQNNDTTYLNRGFDAFDRYGTAELGFPKSQLAEWKAGQYRLSIRKPMSVSPADVQEYFFQVIIRK